MDRRDFMKGAGATGAALTAGGIGILATSGGATATAGADINDVSVTSDDGTIEYVRTETAGRLKWDGFDRPATHANIRVAVVMKRDGSVVWQGVIHETGTFALDDVSDEGSSDGWGGDGEYSSGSGTHGYLHSDAEWDIIQSDEYDERDYPLPEDPAPASPLYEKQDGESKNTNVTLRSTYELFTEEDDGSLTQLTGTEEYPDNPVAESTFTVTVNNEQSAAGFDQASGSASAGAHEDDTDDIEV